MKILLVLSGKGGVGKSTFCAALAAVLSLKQGKKVLRVADPRSEYWMPIYVAHRFQAYFPKITDPFCNLNRGTLFSS